MPIKIFWGSGSTPAWRVLACMEEKNLDYESKIVEFSKREILTPSHHDEHAEFAENISHYVVSIGSLIACPHYHAFAV